MINKKKISVIKKYLYQEIFLLKTLFYKDLFNVVNMFIAPSGGDESLAIGSIYAYLDEHKKQQDIEPLQNAYLGLFINVLLFKDSLIFKTEL
tara:strand:- start:116 stop:391 length:276 start_codon:yes stop_codon:yes gene_type:complete